MHAWYALSVFLSLVISKMHAQGPAWAWARSGKGSHNDEVFALTTTFRGQVVIGGEFSSFTLDLGGATLTNPSGSPFSSCAFIAAYDTQGSLLWARKAGNSDFNRILGLASDTAGNIIAVGAFMESTIAFGSITLTNVGYTDGFVVKYDSSGTPLWAFAIGGSDWDYAKSVATDLAGNIYLTGWFDSPTLSVGTFTLTNTGSGSSELFLVKFSPQGQVLWAYGFGGPNIEIGQSIAVSPTGEIALAGLFHSPALSFGSITLSNGGQADVFIAKFDTHGQPLWAKKAAGTDSEMPLGITITPRGDIAVVGNFWSSSITFDHQTLSNQSASGGSDLFIAHYGPDGQMHWVHAAGGLDSDEAWAVTTDTSGRLYVTGYFVSPTLSFGSYVIQGFGEADVFVVAYEPNGQALWTQKAGGALYDKAYTIAIDAQGSLYVGGSYASSPATFGAFSLPNDQGYDGFVAKIGSGTSALPSPPYPDFSLTPLPEKGTYRVQTTDFALPTPWRLTTATGMIITQGLIDEPEEILDFSHLPEGMYLLCIDLRHGISTWKLLR